MKIPIINNNINFITSNEFILNEKKYLTKILKKIFIRTDNKKVTKNNNINNIMTRFLI